MNGENYDHRKQWVVSRLRFLSCIYAIDVCDSDFTSIQQRLFDLALVDATGRVIRDDKRGFIPSEIPPIVQRFGIHPDKWIEHVKHFAKRYGPAAGAAEKLKAFAHH